MAWDWHLKVVGASIDFGDGHYSASFVHGVVHVQLHEQYRHVLLSLRPNQYHQLTRRDLHRQAPELLQHPEYARDL
jgi:hypothetical protein